MMFYSKVYCTLTVLCATSMLQIFFVCLVLCNIILYYYIIIGYIHYVYIAGASTPNRMSFGIASQFSFAVFFVFLGGFFFIIIYVVCFFIFVLFHKQYIISLQFLLSL